MYQLYASVAPRPQDFPRLLGKIGETMKKDFDFSKEIAGIKATTLIVAADADIFPPAHAVEMFALLGGGQRDGGWDGSGQPKSRLAIIPGFTHYNLFNAPALAAAVIPFLDEPTLQDSVIRTATHCLLVASATLVAACDSQSRSADSVAEGTAQREVAAAMQRYQVAARAVNADSIAAFYTTNAMLLRAGDQADSDARLHPRVHRVVPRCARGCRDRDAGHDRGLWRQGISLGLVLRAARIPRPARERAARKVRHGVGPAGGWPMVDRALLPDSDTVAASTKVKRVAFALATPADAAALAELRTAAARELTERYGRGHWSSETTERGALAELRNAQVWIARYGGECVGTFRLAKKKPWAIDVSYFTACKRPLYLTGMAVRPDFQRRGLGRKCVDEAVRIARAWPADAIRLDAYDAQAGAGSFYAKCGFTETGRTAYRSVPLVYYELVL